MKKAFSFRALVLVITAISFHFTTQAFAGQTKQTMIFDCDKAPDDPAVCLACNIYHEARSESHPGYWLVAWATRNRVDDNLYPAKVKKGKWSSGPGPKVKKEGYQNQFCQVVYEQRWDVKRKKWTPMFSWTRDGQHDRVYNHGLWLDSYETAMKMIADFNGELDEPLVDITFGCQWYHRFDVSPYWMHQYHPTVRIGAHQCYSENEGAFENAMTEIMPQIGMMRAMILDAEKHALKVVPEEVQLPGEDEKDGSE